MRSTKRASHLRSLHSHVVLVKVKVDLYSALSWTQSHTTPLRRSDMARVLEGSHSFRPICCWSSWRRTVELSDNSKGHSPPHPPLPLFPHFRLAPKQLRPPQSRRLGSKAARFTSLLRERPSRLTVVAQGTRRTLPINTSWDVDWLRSKLVIDSRLRRRVS